MGFIIKNRIFSKEREWNKRPNDPYLMVTVTLAVDPGDYELVGKKCPNVANRSEKAVTDCIALCDKWFKFVL